MQVLSRLKNDFLFLVRPPFKGMMACVALYFIGCFLVYPDSGVVRGNMPDTDDYMYMTQVIDWAQGQGWHDMVQYRLNPPEGGALHFTRAPELPMVAGVMLFKAMGLPWSGAATLAALLLSVAYLIIFLLTLRWAVAPLVPAGWASLSSFVAVFSVPLMLMFQPLHIDHTGLVLILVAAAIGAVARMTSGSERLWRWPIMVGTVLGLGLAVALEILPWLLVVMLWLGAWAAWCGGRWPTRSVVAASAALAVSAGACLLVLRPWDTLDAPDLLQFARPYVELCWAILLCCVVPCVVAGRGRGTRMIVSGLVALCVGGLYLMAYPALREGPYGALDPALEQIILGEVREAKPIWTGDTASFWGVVTRLATFLVALYAGVQMVAGRRSERCPAPVGLAVVMSLMIVAAALAVGYERRFLSPLGLFTTLILSCWLPYKWRALQAAKLSRARFAHELVVVLVVGFIPAVLVPALVDSRSINKGVLLFPTYGQQNFCDMAGLQSVLNDPTRFGGRPRVILNTISAGPELLFRTGHAVLSAPYHTNISGNVDTTRFFATPFSFEAEEIARRRKVDLVVMCRAVPDMYMKPQTSLKSVQAFAGSTFLQILMSGMAPAWLKQVKDPRLTNYVVYEVDPSKFSPTINHDKSHTE